MNKRKWLCGILLVGILTLMVACGNSSANSEQNSEKYMSDKNITNSENITSDREDTSSSQEQGEELVDYYVPVKVTEYRNKVLSSYEVYEYDENGNLIRLTSYTDEEIVKEAEGYEYDENGNLSTKSCYNDKGELDKKYEYEYYEDGSIKKETVSTSEYVLYFYEYEYNEDGSISKKTFYEDGGYNYSNYEYDENGALILVTTLYEMGQTQETYISTYVYETEVVDKGQRQYTIRYYNGEMADKVWHTYDSDGRLIEEGEVLPNYGEHIVHRYTYDEQGRIVQDDSDTAWEERYIYEYDENGNVVKIERIDMSHSFIHTTWLYTTEYECIKVNKEIYERLNTTQK